MNKKLLLFSVLLICLVPFVFSASVGESCAFDACVFGSVCDWSDNPLHLFRTCRPIMPEDFVAQFLQFLTFSNLVCLPFGVVCAGLLGFVVVPFIGFVVVGLLAVALVLKWFKLVGWHLLIPFLIGGFVGLFVAPAINTYWWIVLIVVLILWKLRKKPPIPSTLMGVKQ